MHIVCALPLHPRYTYESFGNNEKGRKNIVKFMEEIRERILECCGADVVGQNGLTRIASRPPWEDSLFSLQLSFSPLFWKYMAYDLCCRYWRYLLNFVCRWGESEPFSDNLINEHPTHMNLLIVKRTALPGSAAKSEEIKARAPGYFAIVTKDLTSQEFGRTVLNALARCLPQPTGARSVADVPSNFAELLVNVHKVSPPVLWGK